MRSLIVVSVLALAASAKFGPKWHELEGYTFDRYVSDYGLSYTRGSSEWKMREENFNKRLDSIRAHNSDASKSWKRGVNQFSDWSEEEWKNYNKAMPDPKRAAELQPLAEIAGFLHQTNPHTVRIWWNLLRIASFGVQVHIQFFYAHCNFNYGDEPDVLAGIVRENAGNDHTPLWKTDASVVYRANIRRERKDDYDRKAAAGTVDRLRVFGSKFTCQIENEVRKVSMRFNRYRANWAMDIGPLRAQLHLAANRACRFCCPHLHPRDAPSDSSDDNHPDDLWQPYSFESNDPQDYPAYVDTPSAHNFRYACPFEDCASRNVIFERAHTFFQHYWRHHPHEDPPAWVYCRAARHRPHQLRTLFENRGIALPPWFTVAPPIQARPQRPFNRGAVAAHAAQQRAARQEPAAPNRPSPPANPDEPAPSIPLQRSRRRAGPVAGRGTLERDMRDCPHCNTRVPYRHIARCPNNPDRARRGRNRREEARQSQNAPRPRNGDNNQANNQPSPSNSSSSSNSSRSSLARFRDPHLLCPDGGVLEDFDHVYLHCPALDGLRLEFGDLFILGPERERHALDQVRNNNIRVLEFMDRLPVLSTQQPTSCSEAAGCGGGWQSAVYDYIQQSSGLNEEWVYPFTDFFCNPPLSERCTSPCRNISKMFTKQFKWWPKANVSRAVIVKANDALALMETLAKEGPTSNAVDASTWADYESGILVDNKTDCATDHIIETVGYGYDFDLNMNYWIVRNSWGTNYGENGFIRLNRPEKETLCGTNALLSDPQYPEVAELAKKNDFYF